MPAITETVILGEGLLEPDYPIEVLDPGSYVWDDIVALNPSEQHDLPDLQFPADVAGATGTLVAVVVHPPRKPGLVDECARRGAQAPSQNSEIALGAGTVSLRQRTAGGRPTKGDRTAIGLDTPLQGDAVRSVHGLWVRLELRPADAAE